MQAAKPMPGLKPLKAPIRLSPALRMQQRRVVLRLPIKLEQLRQQYMEFDSWALDYEEAVATMPEIRRHCEEKSYSVQDQQAAGCNGNESLNQCMEKLIAHCLENFSQPGVSIGVGSLPGFPGSAAGGVHVPSVSTQTFREAAQETARRARQLSQQLSRYATQAEQNLNSWR